MKFWNTVQINRKGPLIMLAYQTGFFAFGVAMVLGINTFLNKDMDYACMGSLMAAIGIAVGIVARGGTSAVRFRLAVMMGQPRRSFLLWDTLNTAAVAAMGLSGELDILSNGAGPVQGAVPRVRLPDIYGQIFRLAGASGCDSNHLRAGSGHRRPAGPLRRQGGRCDLDRPLPHACDRGPGGAWGRKRADDPAGPARGRYSGDRRGPDAGAVGSGGRRRPGVRDRNEYLGVLGGGGPGLRTYGAEKAVYSDSEAIAAFICLAEASSACRSSSLSCAS